MEALLVSVAVALMELDKQALAEEVGALVALDTQVLALVVEKKARHPFLPSLFAE